MEKAKSMKRDFSKLISRQRLKFANIMFMTFLMVFVVDRVTNYFIHAPIFVIATLIILPIIIYVSLKSHTGWNKQLIILAAAFILIAIIDNMTYKFHVKNVSDLAFILFFVSSYYFYKLNHNYLSPINSYLFFLICIILFVFAFITFERGQTGIEGGQTGIENSRKGFDTMSSPQLTWKPKPIDAIEVYREYHQGLFRVAHVASYFFGFLAIYFGYMFSKVLKTRYIILTIICIFCCIYTGSRTFVVALFLSIFLFSLRRKYVIYSGGMVVLFGIIILNLHAILRYSRGTILFQYFSLIETILHNFSRLSRYRIWYSWLIEVKEFTFVDVIIGKSYFNSHVANAVNLNYPVWFHNDFLNIFYAYGVFCLLLYIGFWFKIYYDYKTVIKKNGLIFIFYFTMLFAAMFNGFYYYFPVFLLYLFFLMVRNENQKTTTL